MKKFFSSLILFLVACTAKSQYQVTLQTPNYKSGLAYLTYYYGKNRNIEDSAVVNNKGIAVFKKNAKLLPGIYSVIFPGKTNFVDFFVDKEQVISIKADTADLLNKTIVTGSKENSLFQQYQKFISTKSSQLQAEQQAYTSSKTKADSALHENNYQKFNKELNQYRENIIKQYPQSMLAGLFKSMKEPGFAMAHPITKEDSIANYNFYKKHYWDGINFTDNRVIRTPFFLPKVERYFRDVLVPSADTIIKEADYLLLLARTNSEMYKFLLNWLTDEYMYPKYMGQDAVFVHLFEKYHSKGVSNWLNEKQLTAISNRAYMVMSNLIGEQAADLDMVDSTGKPYPLYKVNAAYTVVVFWDPTCGHCREEVPRLDSLYHAKWKQQGVKIYGVLSENEKTKWIEFIKENNLKDWVHVYQADETKKAIADAKLPGYKQLYDITQTPTLYLLDKEKRIIAKKLTLQQMDDVLQTKLKNKPAN
ncbi:MAG: alkyl hydroperoxide reductase/Thiol specific antioxidant/Mal allergen [Chitinophagaceae bacterium]|nr:alkyl hydroperoxide reductase/Thiol specific antioxidant/Mal allergen [Chitinophagaceae bacterium]